MSLPLVARNERASRVKNPTLLYSARISYKIYQNRLFFASGENVEAQKASISSMVMYAKEL
jgi:hypothetical protein